MSDPGIDDEHTYPFHDWAEKSGRLGEAYTLLGRLLELTQWDQVTLYRNIGCSPQRLRAPQSEQEGIDATSHSVAYLTWVVELASRLQTPHDHREVVRCCFEMSTGAGGRLSQRVVRCEDAFAASQRDRLPADLLLSYGEVQSAFATATRHLPEDAPARIDAEDQALLMDPLSEPRAHISRERLELLVRPDANELLGSGVVEAIWQHVSGCSLCRPPVAPASHIAA